MDEHLSQWKGGFGVALVLFIRRWLDSVVNNFRCGLYGHTDIAILERYESHWREKISVEIHGKKFKRVRHDLLEKYQAKCACRSCGQVFLAYFLRPRQ